MTFCDYCRKPISHDDLSVYHGQDFHPVCLELKLTPKFIIGYASWCNEHGMIPLDEYFAIWAKQCGAAIAPRNDDAPPPPLPFPRR